MNRKDVLFWSPRCPHSRRLLEAIENSPVRDTLVLFNVHDSEEPLPNFVRVVPTIFVQLGRKILVEEQLNQYIQQKIQLLSAQQQYPTQQQYPQNPNQQSYPNQQQYPQNPNQRQYPPGPKKKPIIMNDDLTGEKTGQAGGSISDFNPGEMGAGFSDNYSFLENADAVASHNFNFIGNADDTPPITDIKAKSREDLGDSPVQNTQQPQYNPQPPSNMNNMGGMSYDPDMFADNNYNSNNSARNRREDEMNKKYEDLMKKRELSDNLSNLYQ